MLRLGVSQSVTTDPTTNLSINKSGYIGIGTTSPAANLQVQRSILDNKPSLFLGRYNNENVNLLSIGEHTKAGGVDGSYGGLLLHTHNRSIAFSVKNTTFNGIQPADINLLIQSVTGNVGIGTSNPDSKLVVDGKIRSEEIKVEVVNGPDYVFEPGYDLPTLQETKAYIEVHKHLSEIPSAREMEADGIDLGDINMRLLKKIEELTLHQIELLEKLETQRQELQVLKEEVETIKYR
ncbi:MAG: helicase associated domain-containing protein [Cyclobacteriaceae bacterium]|nr:helicase associated domain-containing protein [Cyclobacteriaceae bacterium HetDA_MAG_MS6]